MAINGLSPPDWFWLVIKKKVVRDVVLKKNIMREILIKKSVVKDVVIKKNDVRDQPEGLPSWKVL